MAIDDPLVIKRVEGRAPGTVITTLTGPITLRNLFDLQPQLRSSNMPRVSILDLSGVPYMDSAGMGCCALSSNKKVDRYSSISSSSGSEGLGPGLGGAAAASVFSFDAAGSACRGG
jgi:hypothetical protein